MRTRLRSVLVVALAVAAAVLAVPGTASAAPTTVGYDVSYPQCGKSLPSDRAFAVVGVNGGLSTKANPCLSTQLAWASKSSGAVPAQPRAQVYLNTANPGEVRSQVTTWPKTGTHAVRHVRRQQLRGLLLPVRLGAGEQQRRLLLRARRAGRPGGDRPRRLHLVARRRDDEHLAVRLGRGAGAQPRDARGHDRLPRRRAAATVGLYSTNYQWGQIVGTVPATSTLAGRPSWLAGATSLSGAKANCSKPALVPGGRVTLTQYVQSGWDRNNSCI